MPLKHHYDTVTDLITENNGDLTICTEDRSRIVLSARKHFHFSKLRAGDVLLYDYTNFEKNGAVLYFFQATNLIHRFTADANSCKHYLTQSLVH